MFTAVQRVAVLASMAGALGVGASGDQMVPLAGMAIHGPALPTESESLAVEHFNREMARVTGSPMPVAWGIDLKERPSLEVGNLATMRPEYLGDTKRYGVNLGPDARNQSYVLRVPSGKTIRLVAAGLGSERTPRGTLGMGYALGELLRLLDRREGKWVFVMPGKSIVRSPKTPNRTLYLMNSYNFNPGLSLEYWNDGQIDDYVDRLVDARYSRVSLWQWYDVYLYPGNSDASRAKNEMIHKAMRRVFDRARRRGLEVYHQLAPAHANPDLLPNDPKYIATGYYGRTSICWSQPEARDLARKMAQHEMEYYGPVDGYIVWFYDPGGCFCKDCKPHQSEKLFDQLMTVVDLAKGISPNARFEVCLWPTWAFPSVDTIGYKPDGVKSFVTDFLKRCVDKFGPRTLTVMDSCESGTTNVYNGLVAPEQFARNGFMYSALGMASEQAYPFAGFRFGYLNEQMGRARDHGFEESIMFIQYAATNYPGVFAFADTLYEPATIWQDTARRYASTVAKGSSRKPFVEMLKAMEDLSKAQSYKEMGWAIDRVEKSWAPVERSPYFYGDRDWLRGYVHAQRWYLKLAQCTDEESFKQTLAGFKADLGSIPMYKDFATNSLTPSLIVNQHLKYYWRGPANDKSMIGLFDRQ